MNNFLKKNIVFISIIFLSVVAFFFFSFHLNTFDLHFDEIHCFYWSDPSLTFTETISRLNNYTSAHPPLFFLINKIILNFVNETHVLRYITLFNMMLNSLLFYLILNRIFSNHYYSFFGVILFISNIFIIFHAQRFTNYPLLLFFELFSFLFFLRLVENIDRRNLICFFIINILGITTHLYFLLYLAPISLWLITDIRKNIHIIISIAGSLITFIVLFDNFIFNAFQVGYSNTNVNLNLIHSFFLVYFFGGKYLSYLAYLFIGFFCTYIIFNKRLKDFIYILMLVIPFLTVYIFNIFIGNAWIDGKHLIFFVPFLIIIFLKVTDYIKYFKIKYFYIIPIVLILFGQLIALYRNYYPNVFNQELVRRNVELKKFLNKTVEYHHIPFVIEKGQDVWPGFNHNLKYYLDRNKTFKKSKIHLIDTQNNKFNELDEFMYIYFRDTEIDEAQKRLDTFKKNNFKESKSFKDFQIKGVYMKKY